MAKPDIIIIGGHAYRWQGICELRRQQLEVWNAAQPRQLALFELKDDCRPVAERTRRRPLRRADLFRRHARAPRKRGTIGNSLPSRPTTLVFRTRSQPQPFGRVSMFRRGPRALAAHFSDDPSINKSVTSGFEFRGFYARARVAVQGRSLPRLGEEPRACAAPRRVAVPCRAAFEPRHSSARALGPHEAAQGAWLH
jgi:hypothetical protein